MKYFVLLFTMLHVSGAYARCLPYPDKEIQVKLEKVSAPVYDSAGETLKGCLLHADGKLLGYSVQEALCQSPVDVTLNVSLFYGCCDTGPDSGDVECIVRSGSLFGIGSVHGNGVVVRSVKTQ